MVSEAEGPQEEGTEVLGSGSSFCFLDDRGPFRLLALRGRPRRRYSVPLSGAGRQMAVFHVRVFCFRRGRGQRLCGRASVLSSVRPREWPWDS